MIDIILQLALLIAPIIFKMIGASDATKRAYFEWIKNAGKDNGSAKLLKAADDALEWLAKNPWKPTP
jgi:hypothetical protein